MTNEELTEKFVLNAEGVLSTRNIELTVKKVWDLEAAGHVGELISLLRPSAPAPRASAAGFQVSRVSTATTSTPEQGPYSTAGRTNRRAATAPRW